MTSMHCFYVVEPRADADVKFRAGLLCMLGDIIVDAYVPL
jgi:hypothetical protein